MVTWRNKNRKNRKTRRVKRNKIGGIGYTAKKGSQGMYNDRDDIEELNGEKAYVVIGDKIYNGILVKDTFGFVLRDTNNFPAIPLQENGSEYKITTRENKIINDNKVFYNYDIEGIKEMVPEATLSQYNHKVDNKSNTLLNNATRNKNKNKPRSYKFLGIFGR
jgi:hypothetical protein